MPAAGKRAVLRALLPAAGIIILLGWASFALFSAHFYRNQMPEHVGIGRVVYNNVKTFGFGPGGNETGLIIFTMSDRAAKALETDPERFLASASVPRAERCGSFGEWAITPYTPERDSGAAVVPARLDGPATIEEILNRYGFGIRLPPAHSHMLNEALAKRGSYLAESKCGRVFLMPAERRAALIIVG